MCDTVSECVDVKLCVHDRLSEAALSTYTYT